MNERMKVTRFWVLSLTVLFIGAIVLAWSTKAAADEHIGIVHEVEPIYSQRTSYVTTESEETICYQQDRASRGWIETGTNTVFGSVNGLVGAAVGVAVGSQIGGGSGTDAAMVVGGIIGDFVGNSTVKPGSDCRIETVEHRVPTFEEYITGYRYVVIFDGGVYQNIVRDTFIPVGDIITISVDVEQNGFYGAMSLSKWIQKEVSINVPVDLIRRRRRQILVHSCIYYELNDNIIEDSVFDKWAAELVGLQKEFGREYSDRFDQWFRDWDGMSGFDLPVRDPWVYNKACELLENYRKSQYHFDSE